MNERRSKTTFNTLRRLVFPFPVGLFIIAFVVGFALSLAVSVYLAGG